MQSAAPFLRIGTRGSPLALAQANLVARLLAERHGVPVADIEIRVITTTGDYLSTSAILGLDFSAADVAELINVANLLYNNELYAVISEIGLVAGVDRTVTASGPGGSINYVEALMATITTHITAYNSVSYNNNGFDYDLELGAVEPLVGVAAGI